MGGFMSSEPQPTLQDKAAEMVDEAYRCVRRARDVQIAEWLRDHHDPTSEQYIGQLADAIESGAVDV